MARPARPIVIHTLQLLGRESQTGLSPAHRVRKGTYVRVLLEDIGRALGVPATMAALRRTAAAGYTEAQAVNFAQVEEAKAQGTLASLMLSVETVFVIAAVDCGRSRGPAAFERRGGVPLQGCGRALAPAWAAGAFGHGLCSGRRTEGGKAV